jgi:hypothetical protein
VAKKHKSLSIGGLVAIVETNPIGFGIIDENGVDLAPHTSSA